MVIKLPRSRESAPVAVTPPSTTLAVDVDLGRLNKDPCSQDVSRRPPDLVLGQKTRYAAILDVSSLRD